jgi:hypothetical protein
MFVGGVAIVSRRCRQIFPLKQLICLELHQHVIAQTRAHHALIGKCLFGAMPQRLKLLSGGVARNSASRCRRSRSSRSRWCCSSPCPHGTAAYLIIGWVIDTSLPVRQYAGTSACYEAYR